MKLFVSYIFILGRRNVYKILQKNLPASFSSATTIGRCIQKVNEPVREGQFYFYQLKIYLLERRIPMSVWVSEDATRINGRIQYDSRLDEIVGFVLLLNDKGLPTCGSFKATSAATIKKYFEDSTVANYAYVIMAQPLHDSAAGFCLAIFGSDNCFTATSVME